MKKLNTYDVYQLAISIHPLVELKHTEGMTIASVFSSLLRADFTIHQQIEKGGFVSASIKRAGAAISRSIASLGPNGDIWEAEPTQVIDKYVLGQVVQTAKDFETVLSNEMPGLAIYFVSTKGIYSTDDLISHAELHIPESLRPGIDPKAVEDIQQAGKCLAYEVSTASAFHMWRAVETVMGSYYKFLTNGKSFEDNGVQRNWGAYIKALNDKGADTRITIFLDHIRAEYRNPQAHPTDTVDLEEAFALFGVATSAITQMAKAMKPSSTVLAIASAGP